MNVWALILGLWTELSTSLSCGKAIDFHEKLAVPNFSQNSPQMKRKRSMELNAKRIKDLGPCSSIKGFTWTLLSDAETCATTHEIRGGRLTSLDASFARCFAFWRTSSKTSTSMFFQKHRKNIASLREKHDVFYDVFGFWNSIKSHGKSLVIQPKL